MICPSCMTAGDANRAKDFVHAERLHAQCVEKDCSCQHAIGERWVQRA